MNKRAKKELRSIITVAVVTFILFGMALHVKSQGKDHIEIDESAYHQMESEYIAQVRAVLGEEGFTNSGVTMTKIYEENGTRSYNVLIHHKKIDKMSSEERQELAGRLSDIPFPVTDCHFCHDFLVTNI